MTLLALALIMTVGATGKITLATPGIAYAEMKAEKGDAIVDYFGQQLEAQGQFRVITRSEISQVVGFERQKAFAGCADAASQCMAEMGDALGAEAILLGSLAHLGTGFTMSLKVVRPGGGAALYAAGDRFSSEDALLDWLGKQAPLLSRAVAAVLRPSAAGVTTAGPAPAGGLRSKAWIPFVGAGLLAVGAGACLVISQGSAQRLDTQTPPFADAAAVNQEAASGQNLQSAGWGLAIAAVAAAATGAAFVALGGGEAPAAVGVAAGPQGVAVSVGGRLPW